MDRLGKGRGADPLVDWRPHDDAQQGEILAGLEACQDTKADRNQREEMGRWSVRSSLLRMCVDYLAKALISTRPMWCVSSKMSRNENELAVHTLL